ncbi:aldose epimerase family protein [Sediminibacterium goheungense]|uniref:Aldose 1-epimerase n=1 Tax=Sediminibacterium goheungense TaxID=1086393 RepID=A0A4R6J195_9BACT|nr:aldose epimerase family protein [Sediminibacterium goheungense]TDO29012.1 aldose 1-epimerase [Sediminibacterium goheungense]
MKKLHFLAVITVLTLFVQCTSRPADTTEPSAAVIDTTALKAAYEATVNEKQVHLYILRNASGVEAAITNYGGRVVALVVPDKNGVMTDITLGYDSLNHYRNRSETYFGALIGRYGNRIAKAKFSLNGKTYQLSANNGVNSLHGGPMGFHNQVWDAVQKDGHTLELSYTSKDGEEGYPGNLTVKVIYTLTDANELKIDYEATTDQPTVVNLTNHAYFNLNGQGDTTITDHMLTINASKYSAVDSTLIPAGDPVTVEGTPFDFRTAKQIGKEINADHVQIKNGLGYDHNFVLDKKQANGLEKAASVYSTVTGILMDVYTTEPAIQFYSGNFLDGKLIGKKQKAYGHRSAFCLETQHYPDAPNQLSFPSTTLEPGKKYQTTTIYQFGVQK